MSDLLPPPPDPRDNRAFRDWLFKVYRLLNGNDGELAGQADMSAGSSASASAAANQALILANDSALMQMRQVIIQQSGELAAMRAQVGELQKLAEQAALMARPMPVPEPFRYVSTSTNYQAKIGDFIDVDASGGSVTITMPESGGYSGRMCGVCKKDGSANAVTITGDINGDTSGEITVQYTAIWLVSAGSEWRAW